MSKISFGPRLRALRLQSEYPQATAFAEALGISRATLYLWEGADDPPPAKHWSQLCSVLGISEKHLLLGEKEPSSFAVNEDVRIPAKQDTVASNEIRQYVEKIIQAAQDKPQRLGWILEQLQQHLRVPLHWRTSRAADEAEGHSTLTDEEIDRQLRAETRRALYGDDGAASGEKKSG